jgi:hypothetical protein
MSKRAIMKSPFAVLASVWGICFCVSISTCAAGAGSFYKRPALFSPRPGETKSLQTIDRFGPVGIGIELHQPAFVMKVENVEEGSPAAAIGMLFLLTEIIFKANGRTDKPAYLWSGDTLMDLDRFQALKMKKQTR